jgi:imidazole glycerol-phosphate synthase subunit HisF
MATGNSAFDHINKSSFKKTGMFAGANRLVFELAKDLRKNMTYAEKLLWNHLKKGINGYKFRRQHPISIYIADFYCHPLKLIIEIDGSIHNKPEIKVYDEEREGKLMQWGYIIRRFKNEEVIKSLDEVLKTIHSFAEVRNTKAD